MISGLTCFASVFIVDQSDGTDPANVGQGTIYGGPGVYIPFVNRSFLSYLGPKVRYVVSPPDLAKSW